MMNNFMTTNKTFRELVKEESDELANEFLNQLPMDQKLLMQKSIDLLISTIEQQIVLPIEEAIKLEEETLK